ncbi:hypothetical protein EUTSA_v10008264mg [Eutrema salsugineum]|uniref:Uncharacterized protein n=1 Tax=Eutrema salsugineum TaxID=72664 RepID=V4MS15_EUTSA|nr:uncharacterized protein LOC18992721 [Eutrema salsugineum]ESQ34571.1 hypothetical protein EUTSA_v10008264mg [Eutrema salsugineum]
MIKGGGGGNSSGYSSDLMVCFPSRAHLCLPPKSICSPSHSLNRRQNAPKHRRSLSKLSGSGGVHQKRGGGGRGEMVEEPTSPKVTCAGQIKVRPSKRGGDVGESNSWQSLMAEIEKIRRSKSESTFLGFKKDVTGFLTCLRNLQFDFRCFGAFPPVDAISDEEEEEEEDDESSGTVFSKWFMVLHEKQNNEECVDDKKKAFSDAETAVPPPNALLLMRCRSAPVKNWVEKEIETEEGNRGCDNTEKQSGEEEKVTVRKKNDLRSLMEEEKKMDLVVMSYDTNCYGLSADIAKETWVVSGIQDPLFRSRSWKK